MKRLLYVAILIFIAYSADAQYKWEYGLKIGGANYLGDIGGQAGIGRDFVPWDMHLNQTNIAIGGYGRYKVSKRLALQLNLNYLQINDADAESTNPARVARNLNFRNRMLELGLKGEFTVFYDNDVGGRGYYNPDFRLYVFGGVSVFRHNPQGQILFDPNDDFDAGEWYDLRGWRTEGQEEEYGTFGLAIPAGLGLYFTFYKEWRVGWEISYRTTFTDYLDDLSTTYADPELIASRLSDPAEAAAAVAFSSQTNQAIIDAIDDPLNSGSVNDHSYQEGFSTKRGDPSQNDGYVTTQFTVGKVIRGSSNFYRKKYSWLRNRTGSRKSRAKF
ncbi:MAG: DUF6089 family protein [Flavobacteriales bacterium]|nr:DUF6089 family protein [Flavobacteriales bacterium]